MGRVALPAGGSTVKGGGDEYRLLEVVEESELARTYDADRAGGFRVRVHAALSGSLDLAGRRRLDWDLKLRERFGLAAGVWPVLARFRQSEVLFWIEPGDPPCEKPPLGVGTVPEALAGFLGALAPFSHALAGLHEAGVVAIAISPATLRLPRSPESFVLTTLAHAIFEGRSAWGSPDDLVLPAETCWFAPEVCVDGGARASGASDVWSLGAVLHAAIVGTPPPRRDSSVAELSDLHGLPANLVAAVARALAEDPARRLSLAEFEAALALALLSLPQVVRPSDHPTHCDDVGGRAKRGTGEMAELTPLASRSPPRPSTVSERDLPNDQRPFRRRSTIVDKSRVAGPEPERVFLSAIDGEREGERIDLSGATSLVIGRDDSADIAWVDALLSRRHCRIERVEDEYWVEDLESTNGTVVNGGTISRCPIYHGDTLQIGSTRFLFVRDQERVGGHREVQGERFEVLWRDLLAAREQPGNAFREAATRLVEEELRTLLGFSIEDRMHGLGNAVSLWMVETPRLWIRYSRFPIVVLAPPGPGEDVLETIAGLVGAADAREYFALVLVATDDSRRIQEIAAAVANSIYRFDFIVLGGREIRQLFSANPVRRLSQFILEHGLDLTILSPYVTGTPAGEANFVGREEEVKQIVQGIENGNIALLGGRRIGKTSILQRIHRLFARERRYTTLYLDCSPLMSLEDFYRVLAEEGYEVDPADPLSLRFAARKILEKTGAHRVVAIFDEVDQLFEGDARAGGKLARVLRSLSQEGKCRFVLSGERLLYRHVQSSASPFFNFCHKIPLDFLRARDVEAIVVRPMQQLGILPAGVEDQFARRVAGETSGHPYLVQDLMSRVVALVNEKTEKGRAAKIEDLDQVLGSGHFAIELKRTALALLAPLEEILVYGMLQRESDDGESFGRPDMARVLEETKIPFEEAELDQAIEFLALFRVLREVPATTGIVRWRFALPSLVHAIRRTERPERVLANLVSKYRSGAASPP